MDPMGDWNHTDYGGFRSEIVWTTRKTWRLTNPATEKSMIFFYVKFASSPHNSGLNVKIFETTTYILPRKLKINGFLLKYWSSFSGGVNSITVAKKHRYLTENQRPTKNNETTNILASQPAPPSNVPPPQK